MATRLDQLLDGIEGTLAELPVAPATGHPVVAGLAILDPDDEFRDHHGELVLMIGVRGREALPFLRAAARSGAAAVAVKPGPSGAVGELAQAAIEAGVGLLAVRPQVRWDQLGALLRERLESAELATDLLSGPAQDKQSEDLFALAESTALVTGGIVSIEDTANRVLAYSRSDDVDELRRLSILGWQGPEKYMSMLREWGVMARLRAGEQVVRVEAHPELGIRPRLAIGIRAGSRYLGTIWVQRLTEPFAPKAEDALVGAARLAAAEILRRRTGTRQLPGEQLVELLTGRANTDLVAGRLGLDPAAPVLVVAFGTDGHGPAEPDLPTRDLHTDQVGAVVSMYATAYHRAALVGAVQGRVYAMLSGVRADRTDPVLLAWVRDVVDVVRSRVGLPWRAGVSSPVGSLAGLPGARDEADRVLDALARGSGSAPPVATISELRADVLFGELFELLAARPELRHPGIAALVEQDARRGGELVGSLLAYLDALGDVRAAAEALHVHPNTLRHRLRRAREVSGLALDDPAERLSCHLQLVLLSRTLARTRPAP